MKFSKKTFEYFDLAHKNRKNEKWFEKNKELYIENVKEPMQELILQLNKNLGPQLKQIEINPKKISQPCYRKNRIPDDGQIIKTQASVFFNQKNTSLFEWNPGIYISIGKEADQNILGVGLYMPTSRQLSLMRNQLFHNFEEAEEILENKKLKKHWGKLSGDTYKRFPKGFSEDHPSAKYLQHKQFFFSQELKRSEVTHKDFNKRVVQDFATAVPFLSWVRQTVGTYSKSSRSID